jgi:hypothetical protein
MTMVRSRHRPSDARIDAGWPHQVALPNDLCCDPNFKMIMAWFHERGVEKMTRQVRAIWPSGKEEDWRLHCFRDPADAATFRVHFGGERFDPRKDRENARARGAWHRTGEWRQITASGPLRLHPIFR